MSPSSEYDHSAENTETLDSNVQHLDEALNDLQVPEFEEEVELWTTYGGD